MTQLAWKAALAAALVTICGGAAAAQPLAMATRAPCPAPHECPAPFALRGLSRLAFPAFPAIADSISFDVDLAGHSLRPGISVEHLYEPLGVTLRSGNPNSYVAVDSYVVASTSGGLSAANLNPRWTADIWIDFHHPVSQLGFHVAHVMPFGTGLEVYDRRGQMLGRIYTTKTGTDYLGFVSHGPRIARARVFRVPSIDPNFTIDDLTFVMPDRPQRFAGPPPGGSIVAR